VSGEVTRHHGTVDPQRRHAATGGPGATIWLTGLSGSGKSTIAHRAEELLIDSGKPAYVLDGDNLRHGLNADLGFSASDRAENVRRVGEVAQLMADAGIVVLVALISPYAADRDAVRSAHTDAGLDFYEVHVATPLEVSEARDPKGLYARARAGEIVGFTGVDDPYEAPLDPALVLDAAADDVETLAAKVLALLGARLRRTDGRDGDGERPEVTGPTR
jgi:adenylyl-sulfate kinase